MGKLIWAVGDAANGSGESIKLGQTVAADDPFRFFYLGDVYENGLLSEYETHYQKAFGHLKHITCPIPGNHDWNTGTLNGYKTYWNNIPNYYSTEIEGWKVFFLDSQIPRDPGTEQHSWMVNELRLWEGPVVICHHRPRFTFGAHVNCRSVQHIFDLVADRTALVLSGHDHNMQMFHPVGLNTVQIVVGCGGRQLSRVRDDKSLSFKNDKRHGGLRMIFRPRKIDFEFVSKSNNVIHRGYIADDVKLP